MCFIKKTLNYTTAFLCFPPPGITMDLVMETPANTILGVGKLSKRADEVQQCLALLPHCSKAQTLGQARALPAGSELACSP